MKSIIDRFKNQRVSQTIHFQNRLPYVKQHRVENCHRLRCKEAKWVSLKKKEGNRRAHFSDIQTCGSVWSCPVCASIISERRCQQVQESCNSWRDRDCENSVTMITWTTPHYIFQSLSDVIDLQDRAMRIMKQQPQRGLYRVFRTIMEEMCSIGSYTGRELTFGQNGWHPHRHDLHYMIRANHSQLKKWRHDLSVAFAVAFLKAGGDIDNMDAFMKRAVRIDQINDDDGFTRISKYITTVEGESWTFAQEATKGIVKKAKNGNITPFGMLEDIRLGNEHSALYSAKFWEYAETMKGKKQFFPTPGLTRILKVDHKSDEDLMKENKNGNLYGLLNEAQWQEINTLDIRGEVLTITEDLKSNEFAREIDKLINAYQADMAV